MRRVRRDELREDAGMPATVVPAAGGSPLRTQGLRTVGAGIAVIVLMLAACVAGHSPSPLPTVVPGPVSVKHPNIVFVLTDDLSNDLVQFMPHVVGLKQSGMSFSNYTVTDSLCCPSRSSIFTGNFPHTTRVFTNEAPDGGFAVFHTRGEERHTFATALQGQGYRTAMMGKYLNGYEPRQAYDSTPPGYVPPGWSEWDVAGGGYREFHYDLNENHRVVPYGGAPKDYLTDVLARTGNRFITTSVADRKPFFLELATFAPHLPYTPAPADAGSFLGLRAPRGPSFDRIPSDAPPWLAQRRPLTVQKLKRIDRAYVDRVEAVQSVDRAIGSLETTLRRTGQLSNTAFVFSSDNGYHLGQHGLAEGKMTAFDTDVRVPLVVSGPGVPAGVVNRDVVENIDLAPTFEQLGGATVPPAVDGRSIVALLHGHSQRWRTIAAVEHHGPANTPGDPDAQAYNSGNPPSYNAIRTANWIYVRYVTGAREYYDLRRDPQENHNIAKRLSARRRAELDRMIRTLTTCKGATACWAAGVPHP